MGPSRTVRNPGREKHSAPFAAKHWIFEAANSAFLAVTGFAGASAGQVFGDDADLSIAGVTAAFKIGSIIIFFASLIFFARPGGGRKNEKELQRAPDSG